MSGSLDTNILLRLIIGDIPSQRDAALDLIKTSTNRFNVADVVFIELEYALHQHYSYTRPQITELLQALVMHPSINCNRTLFSFVFSLYSHDPKLSFVDLCLAGYAQLNEATPLWTFDKKLAAQLEATELLLV